MHVTMLQMLAVGIDRPGDLFTLYIGGQKPSRSGWCVYALRVSCHARLDETNPAYLRQALARGQAVSAELVGDRSPALQQSWRHRVGMTSAYASRTKRITSV